MGGGNKNGQLLSVDQVERKRMNKGYTQPLTEMSTRNISWGVNVAGA